MAQTSTAMMNEPAPVIAAIVFAKTEGRDRAIKSEARVSNVGVLTELKKKGEGLHDVAVGF